MSYSQLTLALGALLAAGAFQFAAAAVDPLTYPLGASLVPAADGGGTVFRVWAPNATAVVVRGTFNAYSTTANPMTKDTASGVWSAYVANAAVGSAYKYYLNGTTWRVDPRARDTGNGPNDDCIVTDKGVGYNWQATNWVSPDRDKTIVYEMHVGTFSGNGDGVTNNPAHYRDIVDTHLSHLKNIGINMVEMMPIQEFNGDRSWGYNPMNFYAPETIYGTPTDLRYTIDKLHQNGIGVMLDLVYNHAATDTNLWQYDGTQNIYFYPAGSASLDTGYGSRMDFRKPEIRRFFIDNALMWMDEYKVDGFRFDLVSLMHGYPGEQGEGWGFLQQMTQELRARNPRVILVAEEFPNLGSITQSAASGGRGFDAQWGDSFHDTMRANITSATPNVGDIMNVIANSTFGRPNLEVVRYSTSHDESGNSPRLLVAIDSADHFSAKARGREKIATGLAIMAPGIPMIFEGQEFHEDKQFSDTAASRIWWGFAARYPGTIAYYGKLGNLRLTRASLKGGSGVSTISVNEASDVLAFQRFDGAGDVTMVVANLSASDFTAYNIGAPSAGTWYELVNSQDPALGGVGTTNTPTVAAAPGLDGQPAKMTIKIPAYSLLVFSKAALPSTSTAWTIF